MKTLRTVLTGFVVLVVSLLLVCGTVNLIQAATSSSIVYADIGRGHVTGIDDDQLTSTVPFTQPAVPTFPIPLPPTTESFPPTHSLLDSIAPTDIPPLHTVVSVGPIDPPGNEGTNAEIVDMEKAAQALERHGVTVGRFYHPDANWDQIKAAAEGANFFFYKGHGVYWSPRPAPTVGGLCLSDGIASPDDIRSELHLAPGAIVMLDGCFTAGSAGGDPSPISSTEAQRRVAQYAAPFIDIGAGAYFANVWDESFATYVDASFADKAMGDVFKTFFAFDNNTFETYPYAAKPGYQLWLDPWFDTSYFARWNQAFVGDPAATLTELMSPPVLCLSPSSLTFLELPDGGPSKRFVEVSNTGWWGHWFSWTSTATSSGWLAAMPESGMLPSSIITVSVSTAGLGTGTYDGQVTVTASQVQGSPRSIPVRLIIVDHIYEVYLPGVHKIAH